MIALILFVVAIFAPLATAQSTNNAFKGWFLSRTGENCTARCARSNLGACNVRAMQDVDEPRKMKNVARVAFGKTCFSTEPPQSSVYNPFTPFSGSEIDYATGENVTKCYYWDGGKTSNVDCNTWLPNHERFCCCGQTSQCKTDCFSGENLVSVRGKGSVQMAQLLVGDYVKSLDGSYALVYAFSHYNPLKPANFISLTTESNATIELSPSHMLLFNGDYAPAETASVGDQVLLSDGSLSTISVVTIVQRTGIYAPLTESGNLFVSDILASSYTADIKIIGSAHFYAHSILAPIRWYCMNVAVCHEYTEDGFSTMYMGLEKVYQALQRASKLWQLFITTVGYMIVGTFWFLETMVAGWTLGVFLGFAIVAIDCRDLLQSAVSSHRKND